MGKDNQEKMKYKRHKMDFIPNSQIISEKLNLTAFYQQFNLNYILPTIGQLNINLYDFVLYWLLLTLKQTIMKKNMGSYDKLIRLAISIVIIVLYYTGVLAGILGIIGLFLALYLTLTSLISYCIIYALFGMDSLNKEEK